MRVGYKAWRSFLCLSFISMIVLHGKERETCVDEGEGAQKSGGERGRSKCQHRSGHAWRSVDVRGAQWKNRTR